jgi:hypothetical protein
MVSIFLIQVLPRSFPDLYGVGFATDMTWYLLYMQMNIAHGLPFSTDPSWVGTDQVLSDLHNQPGIDPTDLLNRW